MLETLNGLDTALFLALNGAFPSLDGAMWWVSKPLFWTPLYLAMLWAVGRQLGWGRPMALFAACVALCVTGTDVLSARVLKPSVARLRPSHEPALVHDVHLVGRPGELYRGGRFSLCRLTRPTTWAWPCSLAACSAVHGWGLVAWAVLIGFSRIHLGVHYPGDVLCGFLVGWGIGALALQMARNWIVPLSLKRTENHG